MSLDEEMQNEIRKMEKEMQQIDEELEKLQMRVLHLMGIRKKLASDIDALRSYFYPEERKEKQSTLLGLVK